MNAVVINIVFNISARAVTDGDTASARVTYANVIISVEVVSDELSQLKKAITVVI